MSKGKKKISFPAASAKWGTVTASQFGPIEPPINLDQRRDERATPLPAPDDPGARTLEKDKQNQQPKK